MDLEYIKEETEALKKLSPAERTKFSKKRIFYPYLFVVAGLLLGWVYIECEPMKYTISQKAFDNLESASLLADNFTIYSIFPPVLGFILIVALGCLACYWKANPFYKAWGEYNTLIARSYTDMVMEQANAKKKLYEEKKQAVQSKSEELVAKYGECDQHIVVGNELNIDEHIFVFGKSKKIRLLGNELGFSDILGVQLSDSPTVIKGQIHSVTKTSGSSMVKRAVVGDVLLGGAGAVIGGATAKKNTTTTQDPDVIKHDYTVIVNIRDIKSPIVRVNVGGNGKLANDLVALFNVIIASK